MAPPAETGERIPLQSADPFELYHILRPAELARLTPRAIHADLFIPAGASRGGSGLPAVVQLHGSFGWLQHHRRHRDSLVAAGFVVLSVNTFEARGVESTAERQMAVTMAMMIHDAYRGLDALHRHPLIDPTRIGIAGWSLGGGAAVYAALDAVDRALNPQQLPRFAAHLAVYPGCVLRPVAGHTWSPSPIAVLCGTSDDYTPIEQVDRCAALINVQGGRAAVLPYAGGHHSFDNVDSPVTHNPKFKAMGGVWTADLLLDGAMHITGHPDKPYNTPADRLRWGRMLTARGAHVGGSPSAAPAAFRDVREFFAARLRAPPARGSKM